MIKDILKIDEVFSDISKKRQEQLRILVEKKSIMETLKEAVIKERIIKKRL